MPLSWNEIKNRALGFSREWQNESSEDAEAKSFWDGFFNIFGISRKRLASFEEPVKKLGDMQKQAIEAAAQAVLNVRTQFPGSTLADLYDPLTMPPALLKAHQTLDKAVDAAYGKTGFKSESERVAFLFEQYQKLTSLLPAASSGKTRKPSQRRGNE